MNWPLAVALLVLTVGAYLAIGVLTAIGQRRRGGSGILATGAIVLFPTYWIIWYLRDTKPFTLTPQPSGVRQSQNGKPAARRQDATQFPR
ncbi:hypothetical protein P9990_25100 (plasmid) [Prescottella equi]|uniref:hypothetical protein n=1 Tax=Rhodococcus hoagii TaxID=43767 RepID=UPI0025788126|nr:hypothetical protein [Prescottella equi]WJJ14475.1 hypothetical protein P9990_25100 [Prescottella equi]